MEFIPRMDRDTLSTVACGGFGGGLTQVVTMRFQGGAWDNLDNLLLAFAAGAIIAWIFRSPGIKIQAFMVGLTLPAFVAMAGVANLAAVDTRGQTPQDLRRAIPEEGTSGQTPEDASLESTGRFAAMMRHGDIVLVTNAPRELTIHVPKDSPLNGSVSVWFFDAAGKGTLWGRRWLDSTTEPSIKAEVPEGAESFSIENPLVYERLYKLPKELGFADKNWTADVELQVVPNLLDGFLHRLGSDVHRPYTPDYHYTPIAPGGD